MNRKYRISFLDRYVVLEEWEALGWYMAASHKHPDMNWKGSLWSDLTSLPEVTVKRATISLLGKKNEVSFLPDSFIAHVYFIKDSLWTVPIINLKRVVEGMRVFYIWYPGVRPDVFIYEGEMRNVSYEKSLESNDISMIPDFVFNIHTSVDLATKLRLTSKHFAETTEATKYGKRSLQCTKEVNEYVRNTPAQVFNSPKGLFHRMGIFLKYSLFEYANALYLSALKVTKPDEIFWYLALQLDDIITDSTKEDVVENVGWLVHKISDHMTKESQAVTRPSRPIESAIETAMNLSGESLTTENMNDPYEKVINMLSHNITYRTRVYVGITDYVVIKEYIVRYALIRKHLTSLKRIVKDKDINTDKLLPIIAANYKNILEMPLLLSAFEKSILNRILNYNIDLQPPEIKQLVTEELSRRT